MLFFEILIYGFLGLSGGYLLYKLVCLSIVVFKIITKSKDLASQGKMDSGFNQSLLSANSSLSHLNFNQKCQFNGGNTGNINNTYYPNCDYNCGICINNLSCFWYQDVYLDDIDSTSTSCGQTDCIQQNHCGHGLYGDNFNCDLDGDGVPDYLDDDDF